MRKLAYFILTIIGLFVLTSCGVTDEEKKQTEASLEKQVQKSIQPLNSDERLLKYLSNVKYEKDINSDDTNLHYNIIGTLDDSFEDLKEKEQFDFLAHAIDKMREVNKGNNGNLSCDRLFLCDIWYVEFSTSKETYMMFYEDQPINNMNEEGRTLVVGDRFEFNSKGILVNDRKDNTINSSISETNTSTNDGNDWLKMDDSQKFNTVASALSSLKSNGYTVLEDSDWFVDALNAFYGENETNSTNVTEAIILSGLGGKVITKP
ncbi:hypothetical protein ACQKD9_26640 [Bacillus paramycoides]|uniref:hypothetical protein n=1 Tax=Bacillus paramycoides TaxID=2026194 RepID=UPI003CFCD43D